MATSKTRCTRVGLIGVDWIVATERDPGCGSESRWSVTGIELPDGEHRMLERAGDYYVEGGSDGYYAVVGGPVHAGGIDRWFPTRDGKVRRAPRAVLESAMDYVAREYIRAIAVAQARQLLASAGIDPRLERIMA